MCLRRYENLAGVVSFGLLAGIAQARLSPAECDVPLRPIQGAHEMRGALEREIVQRIHLRLIMRRLRANKKMQKAPRAQKSRENKMVLLALKAPWRMSAP